MHDGSGALDVHEEPNDDLLIQSLRVKLNTLLITTNEREGLLTDLDLIQDNHNALREENSNLKKQNEELLTVLNKGLGTSTVGENGAIIPSSSVTLKPNHFIFPKNSGCEFRVGSSGILGLSGLAGKNRWESSGYESLPDTLMQCSSAELRFLDHRDSQASREKIRMNGPIGPGVSKIPPIRKSDILVPKRIRQLSMDTMSEDEMANPPNSPALL